MCNAYKLQADMGLLFERLRASGIPVIDPPKVAFNLATDVYPGRDGLIFRPADAANPRAGVTVHKARWGLVPFFHKGPLKDWKAATNNARVESCATSGSFKGPFSRRRCLVPFDGFYEWTGPKGAKTKHLITPADGQWRSFAGLWDRAETADGPVESYTIITCPPGPDAARYHTRQPVILEPACWAAWLDPSKDAAAVLQGSPAGALVADPHEPAAA